MDEAFELQEPFEKDCINLLLGIMVSSNQELFDSIKNGGTGIMNDVLREFFKEEIKANEEQAMNRQETKECGKGTRKGVLKGARKDALKDAKRAG